MALHHNLSKAEILKSHLLRYFVQQQTGFSKILKLMDRALDGTTTSSR